MVVELLLGGVALLLVLAGVWLLTGGFMADELLDVVSGGVVLLGGVEVLGGVELLGGVEVLGGVELLGLFTSGVALLLGGVVVLGDVLLLGGVVVLGEVELLGLFTSLCGIVPVLLVQSDEIIFTLLTLIVFELEDDGFVLPVAVPVAFPLPEVVPVTWIMWPTWSERPEVSPWSE